MTSSHTGLLSVTAELGWLLALTVPAGSEISVSWSAPVGGRLWNPLHKFRATARSRRRGGTA